MRRLFILLLGSLALAGAGCGPDGAGPSAAAPENGKLSLDSEVVLEGLPDGLFQQLPE